MKDEILNGLKKIEKENGVTVLLAVESGSRGWGFASPDSDYDIRFVYKYPSALDYLKLGRLQDDIVLFDGKKDYAGYDIKKYYTLLSKSNMNAIDYVFNTLIYIDNLQNKQKLQEIIENGFDRNVYISHNYGLCAKNYHKYFEVPKEKEPTAKRYVYCIRALLSAKYCADTGKLAPLNFYELLEHVKLDGEDKTEIKELVELKKKDREKKWYRNSKWDSWIRDALNSGHLKSSLGGERELYLERLNEHLLDQFERFL